MSVRSFYVYGAVASSLLAALALAVVSGPAKSEAGPSAKKGQSVKCFGKKATIIGTKKSDSGEDAIDQRYEVLVKADPVGMRHGEALVDDLLLQGVQPRIDDAAKSPLLARRPT